MDRARNWLVNFSAGKTQFVSLYHSNKGGAIDVIIDAGLTLTKSYILRCWDFLSLLI